MGCFPIKKINPELEDQKTSTSHHNNKPHLAKELTIKHGLLVQEGEGDPYEFYEETKVLGEGTFGKVFKVIHRISKVSRAMKIIDKQKASLAVDEETALINEINILKSLDHPNILKVYEFFNSKKGGCSYNETNTLSSNVLSCKPYNS
jgi:serine/threonine protein kinase